MGTQEELSAEEIRDMDQKEFRKKFASGWMEISKYETLVLVLDALLESPASREFTTKELANKSGSSERSIENRIDSLVELGVVEKLDEGREEPRYSINNKSPITSKLYEINKTVQKVKNGEIPKDMSDGIPEESSNARIEFDRGGKFNSPDRDLNSPDDDGGHKIMPAEAAGA